MKMFIFVKQANSVAKSSYNVHSSSITVYPILQQYSTCQNDDDDELKAILHSAWVMQYGLRHSERAAPAAAEESGRLMHC